MEEKRVENQDNPRYAGNGQTKAELTARLPKPGPGRGKESEEKKMMKKAVKQLAEEHREGFADALKKISPVLIAKALSGDVAAIKEIHAVVGSYAPTKQDITSDGKSLISLVELFDKSVKKEEI